MVPEALDRMPVAQQRRLMKLQFFLQSRPLFRPGIGSQHHRDRIAGNDVKDKKNQERHEQQGCRNISELA